MPEIVVAAQGRTESGKNANRRLRAQGLIPGIVYGAGREATSVAVSPTDIGAILRSASGENTLFDLELSGSKRKVILKEFQVEPVGGLLLHADFFEVALDKPIEVKVPIELQGTPVGVKVDGGLLDFVTREIEVECLPGDIPDKIVVDVSAVELGKHFRAGELTLPDKVQMLTEAGVVLAHVMTRRVEEEVAEVAPEEGAEAAAPAEGTSAEGTPPEGDKAAEKPDKQKGEGPKRKD